MNVIIFPITAAFFFAITFFLRKQAGVSISPISAYFIESCIQLLVISMILFFFTSNSKEIFDIKNKGLIFAGIAGFTITVGVLLNYFSLKSDLLSKVISITSPAQIIFGILIAMLLLGEHLSIRQFIGISLSISGILLMTFK